MPTVTLRLLALAVLAVACFVLIINRWWNGFGEDARASLPTLASVAVGFGLSELGTWLRASRSDKRQRASVRTLLRIEVAENLAALRPYWEAITEDLGSTTTGGNVRGTYARGMVQRPLPPWSHLMWDAQATALPAALSPQEIRAMQRHYANLAALGMYRQQLVEVDRADVVAQQTAVEIPPPMVGMAATRQVVERRFYEVAARLWPNIEQAATELLEQGVPLNAD